MSKNYPIIQRIGTAVPLAADIVVDASAFGNVLGAGDIDAQLALDTIDDMLFTDISDTIASYNAGTSVKWNDFGELFNAIQKEKEFNLQAVIRGVRCRPYNLISICKREEITKFKNGDKDN